MTKDEFVAKAELKHGIGTYGYDKVPNILGCNEKIEILCYKHGYFKQRASAHYSQGQGCPDCAKEHLWDKRQEERLTTEKFKERAIALWGNEYDYSLAHCECSIDLVKIICKEHGVFEKQVWNHLNGQGCPKCSKEHFASKVCIGKEEIIKRCKETHGDKYKYDLVDTNRVSDKIKIICDKHGVFEQFAFHHINGNGCPICATENTASKLSLTQEEFIKRAKEIHNGFYTYEKTVFVTTKKKVIVTCPKHGDFETIASNHLKGSGCPHCARERNAVACRNTQEDFLRRAKEVHGDRYCYEKTIYQTLETPVTITCPEHGDFTQTPISHLHGNGCPHCHRSKGETKVANFLQIHNVKFEIQKKVENLNLFGGRKYFLLDFYLQDYNTIIEYNGEHHYQPVEWFGGEKNYKLQQLRDESLRQYCKENKIKLIEIPYTEFDNIEEILSKELRIKNNSLKIS